MPNPTIILNLTCGLSFEESDPLMAVAVGSGILLFYDQLTVQRFPTERSQYKSHLESLLRNMRNLLESRSLSAEDTGGKIRVIVTLDLVGGLFEEASQASSCSPAHSASLFQQTAVGIFGQHNPLLSRIDFYYMFLEDRLRTAPAGVDRDYVATDSGNQPSENGILSRPNATLLKVKYSSSPAPERRKDEIGIKSLILVLATYPVDNANRYFLGITNPSLLVVGNIDHNAIDTSALQRLHAVLNNLCNQTIGWRWTKDAETSYQHFALKAHNTSEADPYKDVNSKLAEQRNGLRQEFRHTRRIPFFFDTHRGRWDWYLRTSEAADAMLQFEHDNPRPYFGGSSRVSENEMEATIRNCSYAQLEVEVDKLLHQASDGAAPEDLSAYFHDREQSLKQFTEQHEELKRQMPRLGYLYDIACISILLSVAFAISFAAHFLLHPSSQALPLSALLACVGAILVFCVGGIVAQRRLRRRISQIYFRMDSACNSLQTSVDTLLKQSRDRVNAQREADLRHRNLVEMQQKLNQFNQHNLQVDTWENYFVGQRDYLENTLQMLHKETKGSASPLPEVESLQLQHILQYPPSLPESLCQEFLCKQIEVISMGQTIEDVTTFLTRIEITSYPLKCST